jgi:hypothetical protein
MANNLKTQVLADFKLRFGRIQKLENSQSLYDVGDNALRVYFRYSALHGGDRTFFGLRQDDLRRLEGHASVICFLWDNQSAPLFIPFSEYEEVFRHLTPAGDGQYKVQVYPGGDSAELYLPKAGRFNIDAFFGWEVVDRLVDKSRVASIPDLSHVQIQSLLGAIGSRKQFDVWIPRVDRTKLDRSVAEPFQCCSELPLGFEPVQFILPEVDVVWIERGSGVLRAMFEVEHSTPIYSGLLRFNDIHLVASQLKPTFSIVANEDRRELFLRQLSRPTFRASGLNDLCTFMKYEDVFCWYERIRRAI